MDKMYRNKIDGRYLKFSARLKIFSTVTKKTKNKTVKLFDKTLEVFADRTRGRVDALFQKNSPKSKKMYL